jgi:Family of unknown function (DUF6119)
MVIPSQRSHRSATPCSSQRLRPTRHYGLGTSCPHTGADLGGLLTASSSAVLLIEAAQRHFAVTFGQGRHLLDPEAYEQDFGLKVVLNTVARDQLKSVDAKTIEETTLHTRRDVSRDSSFAAFGLDVSRDLLRAVTGTPQEKPAGKPDWTPAAGRATVSPVASEAVLSVVHRPGGCVNTRPATDIRFAAGRPWGRSAGAACRL